MSEQIAQTLLVPSFDQYFEYMALQNKDIELADAWLLKLSGFDPDELTFIELAGLLGPFKTRYTNTNLTMPCVWLGLDIDIQNTSGKLYWELNRRCKDNLALGVKYGVDSLYTINGLSKAKWPVNPGIDFYLAELLVKNLMGFFTR